MRAFWIFSILLLGTQPVLAGVVDTVIDTTPGGATVNGTVAVGEYVDTVSGGGGGFLGPVGGGTLSVDSDASAIYLGFSGMGDISGNSIRVYFDVTPGGFTELSDGAGFNDFQDFGRERLSRPASIGLILPFAADYGMIISPAFGGFQALFQLQTGGNGSLNFSGNNVTSSAIGENPSNATYEFRIPFLDIGGIAAGSIVDFVVIYSNNNDQDNAFMSNEGFPFQGSNVNYGNGPATITEFHRLQTFVIPEPSGLVLSMLAGLALMLRRSRCRH